jgi:hypothetical protein
MGAGQPVLVFLAAAAGLRQPFVDLLLRCLLGLASPRFVQNREGIIANMQLEHFSDSCNRTSARRHLRLAQLRSGGASLTPEGVLSAAVSLVTASRRLHLGTAPMLCRSFMQVVIGRQRDGTKLAQGRGAERTPTKDDPSFVVIALGRSGKLGDPRYLEV